MRIRLTLVAGFVSLCLTACHTSMKQIPTASLTAHAVADAAAPRPAAVPQPPVAAKKP
jgi:hypothetical protein